MESFLWRNDASQSISELDWFIRRPEQFRIVAADQKAYEQTEYLSQKPLYHRRIGLFL